MNEIQKKRDQETAVRFSNAFDSACVAFADAFSRGFGEKEELYEAGDAFCRLTEDEVDVLGVVCADVLEKMMDIRLYMYSALARSGVEGYGQKSVQLFMEISAIKDADEDEDLYDPDEELQEKFDVKIKVMGIDKYELTEDEKYEMASKLSDALVDFLENR